MQKHDKTKIQKWQFDKTFFYPASCLFVSCIPSSCHYIIFFQFRYTSEAIFLKKTVVSNSHSPYPQTKKINFAGVKCVLKCAVQTGGNVSLFEILTSYWWRKLVLIGIRTFINFKFSLHKMLIVPYFFFFNLSLLSSPHVHSSFFICPLRSYSHAIKVT